MNETSKLPSLSYYTPVELVGIYRSFLERGKSNGVVWIRGIYINGLTMHSMRIRMFLFLVPLISILKIVAGAEDIFALQEITNGIQRLCMNLFFFPMSAPNTLH